MYVRITSTQIKQKIGPARIRKFSKPTTGRDALLFKMLVQGGQKDAAEAVPEEVVEKELSEAIKLTQNPHKCRGCGTALQSEDPKKLGYVPPERFHREANLRELSSVDKDLQSLLDYQPATERLSSATVICQRCFHLKHYGKVYPIKVTAEEFQKEIAHIKHKTALIVKIIDIFDFEGTFLPHFRQYSGSNSILLVANKADLLPVGATKERLLKWISHSIANKGIAKSVIGTHIISTVTGEGVRDLADAIERHRNGLDVFVMGQANTGKSSFINELLRIYGGKTMVKSLTVSVVPGTTLSTIGFPIGESGTMWDTPGVINPTKGLHNVLTNEEFKFTQPKSAIKPIVLRLAPGTSFFLGGLARIDYLTGPPLLFFTVYVSSSIYIHRVRTEVADEAYQHLVGDTLKPPFSKKTRLFDQLVPRPTNTLHSSVGWKQAFCDIVFHGLGWVAITGKGDISVRIWHPQQSKVTLREPLMPFDSELGKKQKKSVLKYRPSSKATVQDE